MQLGEYNNNNNKLSYKLVRSDEYNNDVYGSQRRRIMYTAMSMIINGMVESRYAWGVCVDCARWAFASKETKIGSVRRR